jgi:hypothetical protein
VRRAPVGFVRDCDACEAVEVTASGERYVVFAMPSPECSVPVEAIQRVEIVQLPQTQRAHIFLAKTASQLLFECLGEPRDLPPDLLVSIAGSGHALGVHFYGSNFLSITAAGDMLPALIALSPSPN